MSLWTGSGASSSSFSLGRVASVWLRLGAAVWDKERGGMKWIKVAGPGGEQDGVASTSTASETSRRAQRRRRELEEESGLVVRARAGCARASGKDAAAGRMGCGVHCLAPSARSDLALGHDAMTHGRRSTGWSGARMEQVQRCAGS
ncbi:hypothetical protein E2562_026927 [Oryza meyeriana var. granulata]|uniref:Uncharacterized protein n=1 Tax=Oryza meyeriana var. granulata TaxID=110450 RepID=A0A6G1EZ51_9ORYZ|nr:hypothetical protein E2562_026927 [Oryza meyeriana var. granulata]